MSDWISVNDRLPENDDLVVVWVRGDHEFAFIPEGMDIFDLPDYGWDSDRLVTHWAPIPQALKEADNG